MPALSDASLRSDGKCVAKAGYLPLTREILGYFVFRAHDPRKVEPTPFSRLKAGPLEAGWKPVRRTLRIWTIVRNPCGKVPPRNSSYTTSAWFGNLRASSSENLNSTDDRARFVAQKITCTPCLRAPSALGRCMRCRRPCTPLQKRCTHSYRVMLSPQDSSCYIRRSSVRSLRREIPKTAAPP
jgi:hypothetical protein